QGATASWSGAIQNLADLRATLANAPASWSSRGQGCPRWLGRLCQRAAQGAHGLGVIGPTAGEFDRLEGVLAAGDARGVIHGHGQQAAQPWNLPVLEFVRITAAIESLVV